MNEAFVENAQHDVDDEDGRDQQHALAAQRFLEDLGGALEAGGDRDRQVDLAGSVLDALHRLA